MPSFCLNRFLAEAPVQSEGQTAKRQDQEKEIQNHPGFLRGLLHGRRCGEILESAQSRATFAVPGDHDSTDLQAEQVP
jgi:hypothetical protein